MLPALFPRCLRHCRCLPPVGVPPSRPLRGAAGRPDPLKPDAKEAPRAMEGPRLSDYTIDDVWQRPPDKFPAEPPAKPKPRTLKGRVDKYAFPEFPRLSADSLRHRRDLERHAPAPPPRRRDPGEPHPWARAGIDVETEAAGWPPRKQGGSAALVRGGERGVSVLEQMEEEEKEEVGGAPLEPGMVGYRARETALEATDLLLERIQKERDLEGMLRVVERHYRIMNQNHLRAVVSFIVAELHVNGLDEERRQTMHADPRFQMLLTRLLRSHRFFNCHDVLEVLKMLSYAQVPANSRVQQFYLNLLRGYINELSFGALLYTGQLLQRYPDDNNKLVEALRAAMPVAFELRLARELDADSIAEISRALAFVANYRGHIRHRQCLPLYDALDRWVRHHETDPALSTVLPPRAAAELLIRMERAAYLSHPVVDMVLKLLGRSHAHTLTSDTARYLLRSVRYLRGKYPAEFHPEHRIHALEEELSGMLPDVSVGLDRVDSDLFKPRPPLTDAAATDTQPA
ncbi:uncharacterized protein LOC129600214 [Paramacrobiotus metropolitanus]|uniref:uncharacterized protein LOC129600214 n=1 Tax=Paramacrobiotus metropolitanus TaxID=2943436 RepID=UPI002445DFC3|nr:uncharacterized protein LOC129600214 [Paramacrobiotus metropolitanus]